MKILLITPLAKYSAARWLPIGISYLASILKKGNHEVRLYDRYLRSYILENEERANAEMKEEILQFHPDIIGFSTVTPLIYDTAECIESIRQYYKGIIIAGGHHASAIPFETLSHIPGLDAVCAGESEYSLLSIADGKELSGIAGVLARGTERDHFKAAHIRDLDDLPLPDYSVFNMSYYASANRYTLGGYYLRSSCIITSRGCYNKCYFCSETLTFGKGIRFHSPDYVTANMEHLIKDYRIEGIYFHDNNFLASRSHAEAVCRNMIRKGLNKKIKWVIQASAKDVNAEVLELLAEAGCVKIEMGIESIKNSELKNLHKNSDTGINEKALLLCRKHKIGVHAYFMTGFEDESQEDLNNMVRWIKKFRPHTFSLSKIRVLPGTELYEREGNRYFEENAWSRENIEDYFLKTRKGSLEQEEFKSWSKTVYAPFTNRYHKFAAFKVNSPASLLKMAYFRNKKQLF